MKKVRLGRTNVVLSRIGFGTGPLGNNPEIISEDRARATLLEAWRAGVTLFDTSPFYGFGLAELRTGQIFREAPRNEFVLSTKVGRVADPLRRIEVRSEIDVVPPRPVECVPHRVLFDYSYDGVMRSLEQSMLRLGTDRFDIVLIHDVDVWTHGANFESRFKEAMDGGYRALDDLRRKGAIGAIGVGLNEADICARFARAGDFDTMLLAGRYSLLEQPGLEDFLPLAEQKGIALLLGGVLNSGILADGAIHGARYNYEPASSAILDRVRQIEVVCKRHGVSLLAAALQFPLAHPSVASLIFGARSPEEVRLNLAALEAPIPAALWADLKTTGLLALNAPVPSHG
jgi:D-threo-aldose 1-dehydrogenase